MKIINYDKIIYNIFFKYGKKTRWLYKKTIAFIEWVLEFTKMCFFRYLYWVNKCGNKKCGAFHLLKLLSLWAQNH